MTSFADDVRNASRRDVVPAEWRARQVTIGDETETVTGPVAPVASDVELLRKFGYDPADIEIVGPISQWRKEAPDGSFTVSYYFRHRPRTTHVDLPALYAAARRKPKTKLPTSTGRVTVVCLADVQAGKTGKRGGTPELIDRLVEKREKLAALLKTRRPESTVLLEVGDLFEGFESGGNPMFTNDLSLSQQMDLAGTEVFEFVSLMARHGSVQVAGVPSNHTSWRSGKTQLGNPQDDLGLFVHRQVEKIARAAGIDASWVWPADFDESVAVDVLDTRIGVVHGNQFSKGKAAEWWAKQQHGAQAVGSADVLVHGHWHSLAINPTGRSVRTGRSKWVLSCPTADNGSDWFRNIAGEDSDPGLLVFDITADGFDLQSLTVL